MPDLPRVVYLTHRVPYPPDKGDRIRNYHVLRELSRHARVWLAALADEPVTPDQTARLNELCERVALVPHPRSLARAGLSLLTGRSMSEGLFNSAALDALLAGWRKEADFAASLVSASSLAPYQRRNGWADVPAFVDLVDVDSQKFFDYAAAAGVPKRWLFSLEGGRVRKLEKELCEWAKGVFLVSAAEVKLFDGFTAPGTATTATNGVDLDYFGPQPDVKPELACAFVGALDYPPNVDAAVWFAGEIWPRVRAVHATAEFRVIGRTPAPAVLRLHGKGGVSVVGQVPDVRPHVASAAVSVCPVRIARGLQNKVIEAMAMAKPTVASPPAVAALKVELGRDVLCATTADEWVRTLVDLLGDPARQAELGANGRKYVEEHHHWDKCLRPMVKKMGLASRVEYEGHG